MRGCAAIELEAAVEGPLGRPSTSGGLAASAGRRQQHADRRVEARELAVALEGEVQVHALHVRPAVLAAAEDPVEAPVDLGVLVRPEHELLRGVHPRVHRRHQLRALGAIRAFASRTPGLERTREPARPAPACSS
jgi:hypothetical protein